MINKYFIFFCLLFTLSFGSSGIAQEVHTYKIDGLSGTLLEAVQSTLTAEDIKPINEDELALLVKKNLNQYGYFHSEVSISHSVRLKKTITHIHVSLNQPVRIQKINVTITGPGQKNENILAFVQHFPLKKNHVLNFKKYENAKDDLFETVINEGYLKAVLEKKAILIDRKKNTAIITLSMNTGPQYYFGRFAFQSSVYSNAFLQRFVPFKAGEPFSPARLTKFQQDLSGSRYFKNVIFDTDFDAAPDYAIPTEITVSAPKAQQYNIGLGYGTFTGPRLTLGTDLRHIGDAGQRFSAQLKLSSVLSGISAKYDIPGKNPLTDQYTLGLNVQRFKPKNGESLSETLSFGYSQQNSLWHHTTTVNFLNERFRDEDTDLRNSHFLYPSYNLSHVSTDNLINPTRGNSFNLALRGADEHILSTTDFLQAEVRNKFLWSPTKNSKLLLRGNLGYTLVNNLDQLPLSLNFFAGGINSVRGYPYDSIGPGKYLRVGSIEFQHKIVGNWSAATFYDFGVASNHFDDPLKRGDGFGLIYQSPVGPIKFYVGRAESKKDKPLSIEFSIGPEF